MFLDQKLGLIGFLKIVGVQNQLPNCVGTALVCNKMLEVKNSPQHIHIYKFITFNILLHIITNQKLYENM